MGSLWERHSLWVLASCTGVVFVLWPIPVLHQTLQVQLACPSTECNLHFYLRLEAAGSFVLLSRFQ
jgi:hypothetical protein